VNTVDRYQHAEAFALMTYRAHALPDDPTTDPSTWDSEVIWNSRDGVTPFVITLRNGAQATHVRWATDVAVPDHRPRVGDRIFRDMTEEDAKRVAAENVERYWSDPLLNPQAQFGTKENMRLVLLRGYLADVQNGAPLLDTVTEEMARERGWL
jgi:hypothetical protein